jgi:hypothetical protein
LTDGPDKAAWLAADERQSPIAHLDSEHDRKKKVGRASFKTISEPRIRALAVVNFSPGGMSYGVVPFVLGAAGMLLLTRHSGKTGERKRHVAFALFQE